MARTFKCHIHKFYMEPYERFNGYIIHKKSRQLKTQNIEIVRKSQVRWQQTVGNSVYILPSQKF